MKRPAITRLERRSKVPCRTREERGVTMVLVATAMVAIMAMAALSIDVVTLYLASAEAQRSADAAALSAARILSTSGMTGDPTNSPTTAGTNAWQQACQLATQVATAVAQQNTVGGAILSPAQVTVRYPNNTDQINCTGGDAAFGVNPLVTVSVQRTNLPTFFARIWGRRGANVGATATAEAFNSSDSGVWGNNPSSNLTPVQPRCVKPWIIPNIDPKTSSKFIANDSSINQAGVQIAGTGTIGIIGESLTFTPDCKAGGKPDCSIVNGNILNNPPQAGSYLPGVVYGAPVAARSCAADAYEAAIAGCDQATVYACGVPGGSSTNPAEADLTNNPITTGETATAAQCLTNSASGGADTLVTTIYPYQIRAGLGNPLVSAGAVDTDYIITTSNSIVTIPIYDGATLVGTQPNVTIVGFLQAFITGIGSTGDFTVTVMNVTGCGDGVTTPVGTTVVTGTSPVPVRLVQKYP